MVPLLALPRSDVAPPIAKQVGGIKLKGELAKAIEELIEPETWETAGGEGKIRAVSGGLVVRQVPRVHAQIRVLCDELDWSGCRGGFGGGTGVQGGTGGNPAGQGGGMF